MDLVGINGSAPDCNWRARRAAPFTRLYLFTSGFSVDIAYLSGVSNLLQTCLFVPYLKAVDIRSESGEYRAQHGRLNIDNAAQSRGGRAVVRQLSAVVVTPSRTPRSC